MSVKGWRPVQLPRNLVDRIEKEVKTTDSLYRNISDYISNLIRQELDRLEAAQK